MQIDCDGSRDAGESSEGSEVGGCYRERINQNSFWVAASSLESILFVAVSSMVAVGRACVALCRWFSVCLPSHASIKHSDSRGVFVIARVLARLVCAGYERWRFLPFGEAKRCRKGEFLAERGEVVLFVEGTSRGGHL